MTGADAVVITGIGTVSAAGWGAETVQEALEAGGAPQTEIELSPEFHRAGSSRKAFLVNDAGLRDWLTPVAARRLCRPSRFAVAGAKMALADSKLDAEAVGSAPVVMSTACALYCVPSPVWTQ